MRSPPAKYARTKAAGEAAVLAAFPEAVILRPSIVFGPEDEFFNRFGAMARIVAVAAADRRRAHEVPAGVRRRCGGGDQGGGRWPRARPGTIYELGGPDVASFRELLDKTQEWSGRKRWYHAAAVLARQAAGDR